MMALLDTLLLNYDPSGVESHEGVQIVYQRIVPPGLLDFSPILTSSLSHRFRFAYLQGIGFRASAPSTGPLLV